MLSLLLSSHHLRDLVIFTVSLRFYHLHYLYLLIGHYLIVKKIAIDRQQGFFFITGQGGTGKSELTKSLVNCLQSHGKKVGVCATSGTAACLLKAVTSHRLLGLKLDLTFNPRSDAKAFIQQLDVLFIDEVSMMHRRHFEAVDSVLQKLRGSSLPFGGVSIVLVGDLFQLPPVLDSQQQLEQFLPF